MEDINSDVQLILGFLLEWFCEKSELLAAFEKLKNFKSLSSYKILKVCYHIKPSVSQFGSLCLSFWLKKPWLGKLPVKNSIEFDVSPWNISAFPRQ